VAADTAEREAAGAGDQSMVSQCLSKVQVTKGRSADMVFNSDDDDDDDVPLLLPLPPRRP
jgi:hypothetical protein